MKTTQMIVDLATQSTELFGVGKGLIARVCRQLSKVLYCLVYRECNLSHLIEGLHS